MTRQIAYDSYRRKGIEARRKLIAPVGAWFSRIGRLHQVHHLWQYPYVDYEISRFHSYDDDSSSDFETRSDIREKAWQVDGWADTVHKVGSFRIRKRLILTLTTLFTFIVSRLLNSRNSWIPPYLLRYPSVP